MFSKLMNSNSNSTNTHRQQQFPLTQHSSSDLAQNLGVSSGRELLQRPEAVAILQGKVNHLKTLLNALIQSPQIGKTVPASDASLAVKIQFARAFKNIVLDRYLCHKKTTLFYRLPTNLNQLFRGKYHKVLRSKFL